MPQFLNINADIQHNYYSRLLLLQTISLDNFRANIAFPTIAALRRNAIVIANV